MIDLPPEVELAPVPVEKMYRGVLRGLLTRIRGLYEAIHDRYGDDGLVLIREVSAAYGTDIARRVRGDGEPWGIRETGLYLVKVFNNMLSDGRVGEFSDRRVEIMVPRCPYPMRSVELCRAHTSMEQALVAGLNPDLDYRIEKSVPAGNDVCLHVLSRRRLDRSVAE